MNTNHPTSEALEQMRQRYDRQKIQAHDVQHAVHEQMWLELVRALAAQGALNVETLADQLEAHALRAQGHAGWYWGLVSAAQRLRQASCDPDSLVQ